MITDPSPSNSFALDISQEAPSLSTSLARPRLYLQVAFAAVIAAPISFVLQMFFSFQRGDAPIAALGGDALISAAILVSALVVLARAGRMSFDRDGVTHRPYARLFGASVFTPYCAFEGLCYRRRELGPETLTTVFLAHADPSQSICLFQTKSADWLNAFRQYADWLSAPPVLEVEGGRFAEIAAADVGRPIHSLAAGGVIEAPPAPPRPILLPLVGWWFPAALLILIAVLCVLTVWLHFRIEVQSGPSLLAIASLPMLLLLVIGAGLLWWQWVKRRWAVLLDDVLDVRRPRAGSSWIRPRRDPVRLEEVVSVSSLTVGAGAYGLGFLSVGAVDGAVTLPLSARDVAAAREAVFAAAASHGG